MTLTTSPVYPDYQDKELLVRAPVGMSSYYDRLYKANLADHGGFVTSGSSIPYFTKSKKAKSSPTWKEVRESGQIKMTEYFAKSTQQSYFVALKPEWIVNADIPTWTYYDLDLKKQVTVSKDVCLVNKFHRAITTNTMPVGVIDTTKSFSSLLPDFQARMEQLKNECAADNFSGIDLLTIFAERKETLELIVNLLAAIRHPLKNFKDFVDSVKKQKTNKMDGNLLHKQITNQWLQYRYGIMPLVYSLEDALSILEDSINDYKTSRAKDVLTVDVSTSPLTLPLNNMVKYSRLEGTITISAVGKARFSSPNLRLTDQIGVNFLNTAWELVPYSFVLDWVLGIGDWIQSIFGPLFDYSMQRVFSISVKQELRESIYVAGIYKKSVNYPDGRLAYSDEERMDAIVYQRVIKDYERKLFNPVNAKVTISPNMNIKRWIDLYALSLAKSINGLRKLR